MIRVQPARIPESIEMPPASLTTLPEDLRIKIFLLLDVKSITTCSLLSKEWDQFTKEKKLWTQLYLRNFKYCYLPKTPFPQSDHHGYKIAYKSEFNLRNQIYHKHIIANCEDKMHCARVFDGKVFLAFEDKHMKNGDIRVLDLKTGDLLKQIGEKKTFPLTLDISEGMLCAGYSSGAIKVWDIKTWECLKNIEGNGAITGAATSMLYCNGMLHVGFMAGMIQIWDIKSGDLLKTLNENGDQLLMKVVSLAVFTKKLFVGDEEGNTRCWKMATWECSAFPKPQFPRQQWTVMPFSTGDAVSFNFFNNRKVICPNVISYRFFKAGYVVSFQGHEGQVVLHAFLDGNRVFVANDWTYVYYDKKSELICSLDFKASHSDVFRQIATQFLEGDPQSAAQADIRFLRMPKQAKTKVYETLHSSLLDSFKIYEKLCSIPNPFLRPDDLDLGAFYESLWAKSDPMRKAEAILAYEANSEELSESWGGPARCPKKQKKEELPLI